MVNQDLAQHKGNKKETVIIQSEVRQLFQGRTLVVATMHGKESVIGPLLQQSLGVTVAVAAGLNTDAFGTFSGEVERSVSPIEAARLKCDAAQALTGASLVVASEGSFGAHPVMGFVAADEEVLLLKDYQNAWEIKARVLSTATNFSGSTCTHWEEVQAFAAKVDFPAHGLIIRASAEDATNLHKGINDWGQLEKSFTHFRNLAGSAYIETDMRAHFNPTRMGVIREATVQLLTVLMKTCPECRTPGFEVKDVIRGLPCSWCAWPTNAPRACRYHCQKCGHEATEPVPGGKEFEDPQFCDRCNP
ncbi:MAG TPA: DUF6671 family protein [Flavisolibacter sp.]|nr:DUF6671 family protein [Flavisolibacter sp.]